MHGERLELQPIVQDNQELAPLSLTAVSHLPQPIIPTLSTCELTDDDDYFDFTHIPDAPLSEPDFSSSSPGPDSFSTSFERYSFRSNIEAKLDLILSELKAVRQKQEKLEPLLGLLKGQPQMRQPLRPIISNTAPAAAPPVSEGPLSPEIIAMAMETREKACSVENYAVHLVQKLFTQEELAGKNCNGNKGKANLDEGKLRTVRRLVFCYCDKLKKN